MRLYIKITDIFTVGKYVHNLTTVALNIFDSQIMVR